MTFVQQNGEAEAPRAWRAAVYLRLSKEDGDKLESDSIQNQRRIIEQHIRSLRDQGEDIAAAGVYSDDGCPGGNFDRPAYRRMMGDIEAGEINCVIFKDNSRLGRNYPELGRLMEEYFPQRGVRVISVLNHIDSLRDPHGYCSAIVSFSNIMNDDYIRQLSVKIKSTFAMKRARGEFLGNYAPYGYVKSPRDRHRLEPDPEAAGVVLEIFRWYAAGLSSVGVARRLDALGVPPPSLYKAGQGCRGFHRPAAAWSATTVNTILRDEVYIGNLVQGKRKSASYRTKKMVPAEEREWTVVQGAHEAIVPEEVFAAVHQRLLRRPRETRSAQPGGLLSGFVLCARCGGRMNRSTSRGVARYRCMTRVSHPERCQCPSVREGALEAAVLKAIRGELRRLEDPGAVLDDARRRLPRGGDPYPEALRRCQRERARLEEAGFRLYDSLERGLLDRTEYLRLKQRYAAELAEQDARIRRLEEALEERRRDGGFVSCFAHSGTVDRLDRGTLEGLLDHVSVVDAGHIRICFKFSPEGLGGDGVPDAASV